jgi:hypothetical protein
MSAVKIHAIVIAATLTACSPSSSGTQGLPTVTTIPITPTPNPTPPPSTGTTPYTLVATTPLTVTGPAIWAGGYPTNLTFGVAVADASGLPAQGVPIVFDTAPTDTVLGLGQVTSGWDSFGRPLPPGQTSVIGEPYQVGPVIVRAQVKGGLSNVVQFTVVGQ